jgi:hypothetical protein
MFRLRTIYLAAYRGFTEIRMKMMLTGKQIGAAAALVHEQDSTMTKIDCLIEVAKKLREARALGERSSDRALVYFIDMTIAHVCDSLDTRSQTQGAEVKQASLIKAAA